MIKILKMKNTWHSENPLQIHGGFLKIHHLLLSQGWKNVLIESLTIFSLFSLVGVKNKTFRETFKTCPASENSFIFLWQPDIRFSTD